MISFKRTALDPKSPFFNISWIEIDPHEDQICGGVR